MSGIYEPGKRPRCIICLKELDPAPSFADGEPTFSGFLPCLEHPKAGVIYREEVTETSPAPAIAVTTLPKECSRLHHLKTWPRFFVPAWAGLKRFEVRKNDRGFREGDLVLLEEWDPIRKCRSGGAKDSPCADVCICRYTGRQIQGKISYVMDATTVSGLFDGKAIPSGLCIFGYFAISRTISP